ncbi:MAG TPA: M23 family metallopeptidase [Candidatus Hydrogenedentes bacterium]|nr:M23 family metallopeptidase [Candidatus Hydrogenedentota bacterium]
MRRAHRPNAARFRETLEIVRASEVRNPRRTGLEASRYVVRKGDILSQICLDHLKRLGKSPTLQELYSFVNKAAQANGLVDPDLIHPGQTLYLPGIPTRTVGPAVPPAPETTDPAGEATASCPSSLVRPSPAGNGIQNPLSETRTLKRGALAIESTALSCLTEALLPPASAHACLETSVGAWEQLISGPARLTSGFGLRKDPFTGQMAHHNGIDLAAPAGTRIHAFLPGTVTFSGWAPGYGRSVIVRHDNGLETVYGHNAKNLVKTGQGVSQHTPVALVGSTGRATGPHLHFEVRKNRRPVDPLPMITGHGLQIAQAEAF